jgi:hypothetical protein
MQNLWTPLLSDGKHLPLIRVQLIRRCRCKATSVGNRCKAAYCRVSIATPRSSDSWRASQLYAPLYSNVAPSNSVDIEILPDVYRRLLSAEDRNHQHHEASPSKPAYFYAVHRLRLAQCWYHPCNYSLEQPKDPAVLLRQQNCQHGELVTVDAVPTPTNVNSN